MNKIAQQVLQANNAGVPLIGVETHDPSEWASEIGQMAEAQAVLAWNSLTGLVPVGGSRPAYSWITELDDNSLSSAVQPRFLFLRVLPQTPERSITILTNAHRFLHSTDFMQGLCNARDDFASRGSSIVICAPRLIVPPELRHDVIVFTHHLPEEDDLRAHLSGPWKVGDKNLSIHPVKMPALTSKMRGMSLFEVDQVVGLSIKRDEEGHVVEDGGNMELDDTHMEMQRRAMVNACRGLQIRPARTTFDDIAGLGELKHVGNQLFRPEAKDEVRLVVFLDEFEKMMSGSDEQRGGGDNTGVSQGFNMRLLTELEQQGYRGLIMIGPPGTGKSLYAESLGATYGVTTIHLNLKGMLQKELGSSETNLEEALRVISALAGPQGALFLAAVNSQVNISPEMRRRFNLGIYFIDLPSKAQRKNVWKMNQEKFDLPAQDLPDDEDWSGSDIRNCCLLADLLGIPLIEAAGKIVPTVVSDPQVVHDLRDAAHNRYLSADKPGRFLLRRSTQKEGTRRRVR